MLDGLGCMGQHVRKNLYYFVYFTILNMNLDDMAACYYFSVNRHIYADAIHTTVKRVIWMMCRAP